MKLFVIILCLLSERYLIHKLSFHRFDWFSNYFSLISKTFQADETSFIHQTLVFSSVVFSPIILLGLVLYVFTSHSFGFIVLVLNIITFYYCLGPKNPFYPTQDEPQQDDDTRASLYFSAVNGQLFAIIFWYTLTGPLGILAYRLISLCKEQPTTQSLAEPLTAILDWLPARITLLLYLLVGNFQKSIGFFMSGFFTGPGNNEHVLTQGGVMAARTHENETITLPYAENFVEHALILYLVFLAFLTIASWL